MRERGLAGGSPPGVLLARAAFTLMDSNEDGELSRLEMVRAARCATRRLLPTAPLTAPPPAPPTCVLADGRTACALGRVHRCARFASTSACVS